MIKLLCLNARRINTFGALERLINIRQFHNLSMLAILEPFFNQSQVDSYRMQLLMNQGHSNPNNKIWLFLSNEVTCDILECDQQHITCEVSHKIAVRSFL